MRHIRIPLLVVALSLTLTAVAFAIDLPGLNTWNGMHSLTVGGVGGGGTGRGDVLLGPYYDCRDLTDPNLPGAAGATAHAQFTLIAILNTDHNFGVVGRLRFKEWKRSWEVLDVDIPLTSNDVWVGQLARAPGGGCVLTSPDMWITNIVGIGVATDPFVAAAFPAVGFPFKSLLITDGDPSPLARTEYGHFEFIGEELFAALTPLGTVPGQETFTVTRILPGNRDVQNTLEGTVFIIRPDIAISHQYNMTALSDFAIAPNGIYASPATNFPNLLSAVQGGPDPTAAGANIGNGGFTNLEALLSKRFLDFQYTNGVDAIGTPRSTSVVVTFPTKYYHYDPHTTPFIMAAAYPFGSPFSGQRETIGDEARPVALPALPGGGYDVGEFVHCVIWNRIEQQLAPSLVPISPSQTIGCKLPYEVNVIGLYPLDPAQIALPLFRNNLAVPTANAGSSQTFIEGWGRIDLSPPIGALGNDTRRAGFRQGRRFDQFGNPIVFNFFNNFFTGYRGLPAIGIVMTEFYNGTVLGYYGNTVPWQYGVDWSNLGAVPPIPFNIADPPIPL